MRKTAEILFSLIRYEIFGGEYCGELSELEDEKNLAAVCTLAARSANGMPVLGF